MSSLTERQKIELHKSLIQYLEPLISNNSNNGLTPREKSVLISSLFKTLSIDEPEYHTELKHTIPENYLVKKWGAVVRLQKKIIDLEKDLQNYKDMTLALQQQQQQQQQKGGNSISSSAIALAEWVPTRVNKILRNLGSSSVTCMSIHPFEPVLAMGTSNGVIVIWNLLDLVEPMKILHNAHTRVVNGLKFSTGYSEINDLHQVLLASCSSDLVIKVWDQNYIPIRTLTGHDHSISNVMFHPHLMNQLVSCSRDCSIKVWDTRSGFCLKTFVGHSDWVRKLDLNETGEYVLSCSNDQSVRLSHLGSGTGIGLMIGHDQVVENCKFFNNRRSNRFLDKMALKYIYHGNDHDFQLLPHKLYDELKFKYCVSCGRDDLIKIWLLPVPQLRPHRSPLPSHNPNGTLLMTLSNHSSWVRDLQVHPNGRFLFSCSDDKTIKVWDLADDCRCVNTLLKHDLFVNCILFASPIIDDVADDTTETGFRNQVKRDGDDQDDEYEQENIGYRNYFVSGGVDKLIVWG